MKQKILLAVSLVLMVTVFSGCGYATMGVIPDYEYPNIPNYGNEVGVTLIGGATDEMNSISRAKDATAVAHLTFQIAADYTLSQGDKYFSVYKPEMISNFNGSPINTMEKFSKKCSTSLLGSIGSAFDNTGLNTYACRVAVTRHQQHGFLYIVLFSKKPKNLLVWDAQKVIDYLKKHKEYKAKNELKMRDMTYNESTYSVNEAFFTWGKYDKDKRE